MPKPKPQKPTANTPASTRKGSTAIVVTPNPTASRKDAAKLVEVVQRESVGLVADAKALVIANTTDLELAAAALQTVRGRIRQVEAKKAAILDPIAIAVREIKSLFRPAEVALAKADELIAGKMTDYDRAQAIAEQKEKARLVRRGDTETEVALRPAAITTEKGTVSFVSHPEVVVVDEAQIPRKWLVPDMVAIRRAVLAGETIPGVEKRDTRTPMVRG